MYIGIKDLTFELVLVSFSIFVVVDRVIRYIVLVQYGLDKSDNSGYCHCFRHFLHVHSVGANEIRIIKGYKCKEEEQEKNLYPKWYSIIKCTVHRKTKQR